MTTIRNHGIRKPLVFVLTLALLITGMNFGMLTNVYADEPIGLSSLKVITPGDWGDNTTDALAGLDSNQTFTMTVANTVTGFQTSAVPSGDGVTMAALYRKAGTATEPAVDITSGAAASFDLEVGKNLLDLTIAKESNHKTYHLIIERQPVLASLDVSFLDSPDAPQSLISSDTTKVNIANSSVTGISVTAIRANENQTIAVRYTKAGAAASAPISLTSGTPETLADSIATGNNIFEFTVTEDGVSKTYTYTVSQIGSGGTTETINTMIDSITSGISTYDSDWIIGMCAAGKASSISESEKNAYLSTVLIEARQPSVSVNKIGTLSKMIIALTAMGIDPQQVPDADGLPINLVSKLSNATTTGGLGPYGIYTAPYILLAYDSGNYEVSESADLSRSEVIRYMLNQQTASCWGGDVDTTAMVLPALAPYQTTGSAFTDEALAASVNTAVDNAVTWLSAQQEDDGSFSYWGTKNSNSTSMVILGLSALGINADTDSRFIKVKGISALKDLLSYQTSDHQFGKTDTTYNAFATQQGYLALAAYRSLANNASNGGNIYKFSPQVTLYEAWPSSRILTDIIITSHPAIKLKGSSLSGNELEVKAKYKSESTQELVTLSGPGIDYSIIGDDFSTPGTKTVQVLYYGKTASFIVVINDPSSSSVNAKTVSIRVRGANGATLLSDSDFVIDENRTSVLDVLKSVLGTAGYTVVLNAAGDYVESIDGVGEFDFGKNSGWLYSVNGVTPPTTSSADYLPKNGDSILWYYTEDYTKDSSSSGWSSGSSAEKNPTVFKATVDAYGNATASITKSDLNKVLTGEKNSLVMSSSVATLTFDKNVVKTIADNAGKDIKIGVAKADTSKLSDEAKAQIGNRPVYDFTITSNGKSISKLNGKVNISIPYTPASGEATDALVIYYINDSGKLEMIKNCKYDSATKSIVFTTDHFSSYAIGYHAVSFTDISGHWSESNIRYLAARTILNGKSEGKFMPNDNITRAEFVTILANKSGVDFKNINESSAAGFRDIRESDWFSKAVAWGSENKIITGSNGIFRPNDNITRQEMAVILDRYMTTIDQLDRKDTGNTAAFRDSDKIAGYAKSSVAKMQQMGIINGKTADTFAPTDYATRGETAKMIAVFLQSTI